MRRAPHEERNPRPLQERYQPLVSTLGTTQPQETVRQDAAFEERPELVLDERGHT